MTTQQVLSAKLCCGEFP